MNEFRKGTREAEKARKLVRERGGVTQRFSYQQQHGPSTKKRFEGEIKGKDLRRRSLTVTCKNKEHASRKVRPF